MVFQRVLQTANRRLLNTPERALDEAYRAALKIKDIEDKHFQGRRVKPSNSNYGSSVNSYFISEIKNHLQTIRLRMIEFKASKSIVNTFGPRRPVKDSTPLVDDVVLEKLNIIDNIVGKYNDFDEVALEGPINSPKPIKAPKNRSFIEPKTLDEPNGRASRFQKATETPGVLPRSFTSIIDRIKQEMDPQSGETEEEVLKRFRNSRYKTAISIKFFLLLIIVPLLTHQITKTFIISPLVVRYFDSREQIVFLNQDLEEEAFTELKRFEESLRFKSMVGLTNPLTTEQIEEKLKERANELKLDYREQGLNAVANIFADLCSLIAFGVVVAFSRKEIEIVKAFLDNILYNLSDSAKAFLIILFTDMFVGFHSPHGWEVVLEGVSRHFGLPENRDFNFLFIATFPVILDTVLKYWIFRYLNRISPSAVATYRNMNE